MIIELCGANTHNKGAELMLRAAVAQLGGEYEIAVEPRVGSYRERSQLGLLQKVDHPRASDRAVRIAGRLLPPKLRGHAQKSYGLVFDDAVDAVLDAAGFAYSDQFDLDRSVRAGRAYRHARSVGRPVVLLPQAFGPFESREHRAAFWRIVDCSTLAFARDSVSYGHARAAGVAMDRVKVAPDFTNLLPGVLPSGFEMSDLLALIVPSAKLLTETAPEVRTRYIPFLVAAVRLLLGAGMDVRIVQHERGDTSVIEALQQSLATRLPEIRYENALHLKGVLGASRIVVGSRFHALVSALSQGVPALGVGWSHKYQQLFSDYGCADAVVAPTLSLGDLEEHLQRLLEGRSRDQLVDALRARANSERQLARDMWTEVRGVLS